MLRMNFIGVEVVLVFGDNCKHCVKITVAHHFVFNEGETFDLGNFSGNAVRPAFTISMFSSSVLPSASQNFHITL